MVNLQEYSAHGASVQDRMVEVSETVSLHVISFIPATEDRRPPIVFVAGWISQIFGWKDVLLEMTKYHTVHYVETREKITSCVKGAIDCRVEAIGDDIVKLIERLDLLENNYVLFGSSLGATAIVECYRHLTRKPLALALVGPNAVFYVPRIWKAIVTLFYPPLYALIRPPVKWYLKTFRLDVRTDRAQYEKYCIALDEAEPWKLKNAVIGVWNYRIWDRLASLDCPVLLIGASRDVLHEHENLTRMATMIPQATVIDLETNSRTHSASMVVELNSYLRNLSQRPLT
jgi:pimeloyl-ACP methyl ester carboxylesterase